jgi:hypothetical protein
VLHASSCTATLGIELRGAVLISEGSGMQVLAGDGSRVASNSCNPVERRGGGNPLPGLALQISNERCGL